MIHLEGVRAKSLPIGTQNGAVYTHMTLSLPSGRHAVVGAEPAAARLLLDLIAGLGRARGGRVRVLERAPGDPAVTGLTAYVPLDVVLPDALTVAEVASLDAAIRGVPAKDPQLRLDVLDAAWLAGRRVHTLTRPERRAVALALALTSGARILLMEEPFVDLDGRAAPRLARALHAFAADGVCVLLTTASRRDASLLGARVYGLVNERLVAEPAPAPRALEIVVDEPMRLAASLAGLETTRALRTTSGSLVVETTDLERTATAVARAASEGSVSVSAIFARDLHVVELESRTETPAVETPAVTPAPALAATEPP